MSDQAQEPKDRFTLFLSVACAVLAVLTILLAIQNMTLKSRLAAAVNAPPAGGLKVGDRLAAFDVVDGSGHATHVGFEDPAGTLLLVFSSTCGACRETIPVWNRVVAEAASTRVHIVGIQTDFREGESVSASIAIPDLRLPVFGLSDPHGPPMSKIPAIPAAALIDGQGSVKAVWFGVPSDDQVAELRRALAR